MITTADPSLESPDRPLLYGATPNRRALLQNLVRSLQSCRCETYELWDHSLAVATMSRRLAQALQLTEPERSLCWLGGLLHDVGKTLTLPETLFKPGPLDRSEREHLELHPALGAHLVRGLRVPEITEAVLHHHELHDGTGYPHRLRGNDIPLVARIVAVADYYEALRECRPYRPTACSHRDALELVESVASRGKLDPVLVATLGRLEVRPRMQSKYFEVAAYVFESIF